MGADSTDRDGHPYSGGAAVAALPSSSELLCAVGGQLVPGTLCRLARDLADVHRQPNFPPRRADRFAVRRAGLIADIDAWASVALPHPAIGAHRHQWTLGETIDRIAAVAADAFRLLMTDDPAGDRVHAEWTRLAELEVGYGDLVRDLREGRRYLPPQCSDERSTGCA
ncbi:MAG: hypothetical protein J2P18_13285 [Nocardia sp.]|nr:hypothetical protein [Nocardia sp.]